MALRKRQPSVKLYAILDLKVLAYKAYLDQYRAWCKRQQEHTVLMKVPARFLAEMRPLADRYQVTLQQVLDAVLAAGLRTVTPSEIQRAVRRYPSSWWRSLTFREFSDYLKQVIPSRLPRGPIYAEDSATPA